MYFLHKNTHHHALSRITIWHFSPEIHQSSSAVGNASKMYSCLLHLWVFLSREISTLLQLSASQTLILMTLSPEQFTCPSKFQVQLVWGRGGGGSYLSQFKGPSRLIRVISFTIAPPQNAEMHPTILFVKLSFSPLHRTLNDPSPPSSISSHR